MEGQSELFKFLGDLAVNGNLMPFMIFLTIIALILVFGIIAIIKVVATILSKKKFGVKIGDKEFNYNGEESSVDGMDLLPSNPKTNIEKFGSTIVSIVNYSIENGYENCRIRQQLFDSQMRTIEGNIELLLTSILNEYMSAGGQNQEVAKVLTKHALDKIVLVPLRRICKEDRMAERTREKVIEMNRAVIDGMYNQVKFELIRLAKSVQQTEKDSGVTFTYQDEILMKALENQKDSLRRIVVESLERAHEDATKFLEEVHENNKTLNTKVSNSMKQYLESVEEHEKLPKEWLIDRNATPPNNVVGD